jgi:hypothetical protein
MKKSTKDLIFVLYFFFILIIAKILKLLCFLKYNENYDSKEKHLVLFTSETIEWRRILDYPRNSYTIGDQFFNLIIKNLKQKEAYNLFGTYVIKDLTKDIPVFYSKMVKKEFNFLPLDFFYEWSHLHLFFHHNERKSKGLVVSRQIFLSNLYLNSNIKLLAKINPAVILIESEYGNYEKSLILAGKSLSIPTIALQHGVITPTHKGYIHTDLKARDYLPDITCLFGEADRDCLLNHSIYSPEQLVVTGSPRYDIIYHASKVYSRDRFCREHGIPLENRIILWTTQSHGIGMEGKGNIQQLDLVFSACDALPNITLVIKQHPAEKKKHFTLIRSYCNNHRCKSIIIAKNSDTFESLYVSNLVITGWSTTGYEAVAFRKPLIVLDNTDRAGYIKNGVGVGVSSVQNAIMVISRLLEDSGELASNQEEYIRKHFYAIDGKSTERVVRIMEKVISERVTKTGTS